MLNLSQAIQALLGPNTKPSQFLYLGNDVVWDTGYPLIFEDSIHIVPGTFNPPHDGHFTIFDAIPKQRLRFFEYSVHRDGKELLPLKTIRENLDILWGGTETPIFITNTGLFSEKIKIFHDVVFHIGIDTYNRICQDDSFGYKRPLNGQDICFVVYPRVIDGIVHSLPVATPHNCFPAPASFIPSDISSSSLRTE